MLDAYHVLFHICWSVFTRFVSQQKEKRNWKSERNRMRKSSIKSNKKLAMNYRQRPPHILYNRVHSTRFFSPRSYYICLLGCFSAFSQCRWSQQWRRLLFLSALSPGHLTLAKLGIYLQEKKWTFKGKTQLFVNPHSLEVSSCFSLIATLWCRGRVDHRLLEPLLSGL